MDKDINIDEIFNDFDYEEECELDYKIGDYVIVRGDDYGGIGNGIKGIIITRLQENNHTNDASGILIYNADFVVSYCTRFKPNKRIKKEHIIRHTNEHEKFLCEWSLEYHYQIEDIYIKEQGWMDVISK